MIARPTSRMSRLLAQPEARLALIMVLVFALMAALAPDRFLTPQNATSMAFQVPEFAILALAWRSSDHLAKLSKQVAL